MRVKGPKEVRLRRDAKGLRFAIVVSRYNIGVTQALLDGALDAIVRHGGTLADQTVVWAPGAFEIPILAKALLAKGGFDGLLALGCVMKGATSHDDLIVREVSRGIAAMALEYDVPCAFGVLTPTNMEMAMERADSKKGNKGAECAIAAIETARALRAISKK